MKKWISTLDLLNKRSNRLALIFFLLSSISAHAQQALTWTQQQIPQTLQMCWHDGPPYASKHLKEGGIVTDFVRSVMFEAGFKATMHFVPWARCKEGAKSGQYDMLFAMWNEVDSHQLNFDFLMATNIEHTNFVVLKNSPLQSSKLSDLNNARVALLHHGGYNKKLINHQGLTFHYAKSDLHTIKMLIRGRVDLIIGDRNRFDYELTNALNDDSTQLRNLTPPLKVHRSTPAIAKNNPHNAEIIRRYNEAYLRLCEQGTLSSLIKKHHFNFEPVDCPKK